MEILNQYYAYYAEIEKAFLETESCVAIDIVNYNTYSIRYNWLLQSICSEIDSLFKTIAREVNEKNCNNISKYYFLSNDFIPTLFDDELEIRLRNITIKPFGKWKSGNNPEWWLAYNGIKHNREQKDMNGLHNYKKANLQNVLDSLGALYLLENYLVVFSERDNNIGARKMIDAKGELFVCKGWAKYYQGFMGQKLFHYSDFVDWLRSEGVKC